MPYFFYFQETFRPTWCCFTGKFSFKRLMFSIEMVDFRLSELYFYWKGLFKVIFFQYDFLNLKDLNSKSKLKIKTRNRNLKAKLEIETRNQNSKSKLEIKTRNRNLKSKLEIKTRNQNSKSKLKIETRNSILPSEKKLARKSWATFILM